MIYNKSGHPVEVKKISIRLWNLRDEIEAAIGRRMKECEAAGVPLFIEDIKQFYNFQGDAPQNVLQLKAQDPATDGVATLMESIGDEVKEEEQQVEDAPELKAQDNPENPESAPAIEEENKTLNEAEEIIAEQTLQGLETKKPNPILDRPYQRQAPDLDKISYGFAFLSDITMDQILSFTKDKFLHGQSVIVDFLIPQNFMMTATVLYCHNYAMRSRIISSTKPDYRLQCKFSFSIKNERENLRHFLKSIEPVIPKAKKKAAKAAEDDSLEI